MAPIESSIMGTLRESTRSHHKDAESRPLQRSMARGTLSRGDYVTYLGQLRHAHAALETSLDAVIGSCPVLAGVFTDERRRVPDLDRDLESFGVTPETIPVLPATQEFIDRVHELASSEPAALLGPLYVLEGSTNGGRFLARVLEKSLHIEDGAGISYMDPYGERQPEMWSSFKAAADAVELTPDQARDVTAAAGETFRAIASISDSILPSDDA